MECDLYARVQCSNKSICEFMLLMLGCGNTDDIPVFEDEAPPNCGKIFNSLEFANAPSSVARRDSSYIVEAHWFFGDTQVAKEHLEMLADLGVQSCYAILRFETGDVLLLCTDGENTFYSKKWEEDTWDRARDSSSDLIAVLDDIANAGGVVQK